MPNDRSVRTEKVKSRRRTRILNKVGLEQAFRNSLDFLELREAFHPH